MRNCLIGTIALTLSASANAAVLYDESVNGDMTYLEQPLLNLEIGSNTVIGTSVWSSGYDYDYFNFTIPENNYLNYIYLRHVSVNYVAINWTFRDNITNTKSTKSALLSSPTIELFTSTEQFASNGSSFRFNTDGGTKNSEVATINYELEFVVGPTSLPIPHVPIPSAVWLFGSGLVGLIGVARRKKA